MKPILCLDFDGVLHSYSSRWQGATVIPDPPVPGALKFVVEALDHFTVAILSSRSHRWGGRRAMKRWLSTNLINLAVPWIGNPLGGYDDTPAWWANRIAETAFADPWDDEVRWAAELVVKQIQWPLFKPSAMLTIDDRALTFTGTWPRLDDLMLFKPWNKQR